VRHQGENQYFSSAWVGLGNANDDRQLQAGITTSGRCKYTQGRPHDKFQRRVEYVDADGISWLKCYGSRALNNGEAYRYRVAFPSFGVRGRAYIAPPTASTDADIARYPAMVSVYGHRKRTFRLGNDGGAYTQALGEVNRLKREMSGTFSNVRVNTLNKGFADPEYGFLDWDPNFIARGSTTSFCVSDTGTAAAKGCQ
jgi:hypothetical protein